MGEHSTSKAPVKKVTAQTAGGAAVVLAVWVASLFGVQVPFEVAGAATILAGFGAGYLKGA